MNSQSIPALDKICSASILKPFSKIKLIALDLDGTLLISNNSPLPNRVNTLTKSLRHYSIGVHTTLATGRTLNGSKNLINDLGLTKHTPIIIYNGAVVINNFEKVFEQKFLSKTAYKEVLRVVSDLPVKVLAYCLYTKNGKINEIAHGWSNIDKPIDDYNSMPIQWHTQYNYIFDEPPSAMVIHFRESTTLEKLVFELEHVDDISYTHGSSYIEICPISANKGNALKRVAELMNLSSDQVLAMGDNDNDAKMLKWAGIGVAVKNASDLALKNSDFTSNFGVLKGAIEVLQVVLQAHKTLRNKIRAEQHQANLLPIKTNSKYHSESFQGVELTRFISKSDLHDFVNRTKNPPSVTKTLEAAISNHLLPKYYCNNDVCFLSDDFYSIFNKVNIITRSSNDQNDKVQISKIVFNDDDYITGIHNDTIITPAFSPAVINLVSFSNEIHKNEHSTLREINYVGDSKLFSKNVAITNFAEMQKDRIRLAESEQLDNDSRNPYYLGTKRALCGFIIESIMLSAPKSIVMVDLMCGSGVVSGAFNQFWKTYASDSQEFCRQLAIVHGGGFSKLEALDTIERIAPIAEQHFDDLRSKIPSTVSLENEIFCSETNQNLAIEYNNFIRRFPTISNTGDISIWNPQAEVQLRKNDFFKTPYCLFTSYFANTYFGIRQSMEIDSLRYAIDQVHDSRARDWALGALISTVSSVGSTYGGHFAQPRYKNIPSLSNRILSRLFDIRSHSVMQDFRTRFINISKISESRSQTIETVCGPWKQAINSLSQIIKENKVIVYLDPPYTRDEYSRYYHVLETLVKYNYPTCTGNGLTPEPGERFKSELCSRKKDFISKSLVRIISYILNLGWSCAWSYSTSGMADIHSVINCVSSLHNCNIRSFSTPFVHRSHGGSRYKDVVEYLIVFSPL